LRAIGNGKAMLSQDEVLPQASLVELKARQAARLRARTLMLTTDCATSCNFSRRHFVFLEYRLRGVSIHKTFQWINGFFQDLDILKPSLLYLF